MNSDCNTLLELKEKYMNIVKAIVSMEDHLITRNMAFMLKECSIEIDFIEKHIERIKSESVNP